VRFLDHLTFGQYVPSDSLIHRLDPRGKILATLGFLVGLFGVEHPLAFLPWGGVLVAACLCARLPLRLVVGQARPVLFLILLTAALHLFLTPGHALWSWGVLSVTREGVELAFRMSARVLLLVLFAGLLTLTTSPTELSDGLERLLAPFERLGFPAHEMAMMTTIALRFIPTLLDETDRIMKAQLSRGADLDRGGLLRRLKAFVPVLVPLFLIVFQRADDLATAMEARGYRGGKGRTRLHPLVWKTRDTLAVGLVVLFVGATSAADRLLRP
jgi:energy-coupling factor transport system permease protein